MQGMELVQAHGALVGEVLQLAGQQAQPVDVFRQGLPELQELLQAHLRQAPGIDPVVLALVSQGLQVALGLGGQHHRDLVALVVEEPGQLLVVHARGLHEQAQLHVRCALALQPALQLLEACGGVGEFSGGFHLHPPLHVQGGEDHLQGVFAHIDAQVLTE
ncbi:hypothetical protein POKO110462_23345 [Pontibacter korlensis]